MPGCRSASKTKTAARPSPGLLPAGPKLPDRMSRAHAERRRERRRWRAGTKVHQQLPRLVSRGRTADWPGSGGLGIGMFQGIPSSPHCRNPAGRHHRNHPRPAPGRADGRLRWCFRRQFTGAAAGDYERPPRGRIRRCGRSHHPIVEVWGTGLIVRPTVGAGCSPSGKWTAAEFPLDRTLEDMGAPPFPRALPLVNGGRAWGIPVCEEQRAWVALSSRGRKVGHRLCCGDRACRKLPLWRPRRGRAPGRGNGAGVGPGLGDDQGSGRSHGRQLRCNQRNLGSCSVGGGRCLGRVRLVAANPTVGMKSRRGLSARVAVNG